MIQNITLSLILSEPSCSPINNQGVTWNRCDLEENQWFGITDLAQTSFENAVHACNDAGGELISITSETIDQCAFSVLMDADIYEELVLYSGYYFDIASDWFWCPRLEPGVSEVEACDSSIDTTNWLISAVGNCMGGYINLSANEIITPTYQDYGWLQRNSRSLPNSPLKAMCHLNCDTLKHQ